MRRLTVSLLAGSVLALSAIFAGPATAGPTPSTDPTVQSAAPATADPAARASGAATVDAALAMPPERLRNAYTNKCLNLTGLTPGYKADQYTCNGAASQTWKAVSSSYSGDGYVNQNSGLCMTANPAVQNAQPVSTYCNSPSVNPDQTWMWTLDPNGGGGYMVASNVNPGLCLAAYAGGGEGSIVFLSACNGNYQNQWWFVEYV